MVNAQYSLDVRNLPEHFGKAESPFMSLNKELFKSTIRLAMASLLDKEMSSYETKSFDSYK